MRMSMSTRLRIRYGVAGEQEYEEEGNIEPRKRLRLTRANFFEIVKANFVAAREIMIEFVFSLWENGFVPGSVTRPTGMDSIIRLTRGRPGERFCPSRTGGPSSPRRVFDRTGYRRRRTEVRP